MKYNHVMSVQSLIDKLLYLQKHTRVNKFHFAIIYGDIYCNNNGLPAVYESPMVLWNHIPVQEFIDRLKEFEPNHKIFAHEFETYCEGQVISLISEYKTKKLEDGLIDLRDIFPDKIKLLELTVHQAKVRAVIKNTKFCISATWVTIV